MPPSQPIQGRQRELEEEEEGLRRRWGFRWRPCRHWSGQGRFNQALPFARTPPRTVFPNPTALQVHRTGYRIIRQPRIYQPVNLGCVFRSSRHSINYSKVPLVPVVPQCL